MTLAETFRTELLDVLDETFEQEHGIYLDCGTSLLETLATISAEEASRPISATCATLAAQVEHVRFYLDVLEKVLRKQELGAVNWKEIWETVRGVTPEEWEASKKRLKDSYQRVLTSIKGIETWEGENELSSALAILVHTAYHLGEIRQALCTIKK